MSKTNNPSGKIKVYSYSSITDRDKWDDFIKLSDFETYKAEKEKEIEELKRKWEVIHPEMK